MIPSPWAWRSSWAKAGAGLGAFRTKWASVAAVLLLFLGSSRGQEATPAPPVRSVETYQLGHSPLNEAAALEKNQESAQPHYLIPMGSGGVNVNVGLKVDYVDNLYLTEHNTSDDFILVPEANISGLFPVGNLNSFAFDTGLAYYQYLRHSGLNTGAPVINPNSDLAFNLRAGDFKLRFSEAFSYQESPVYETGAEFYNLYNTARFQRYLNRVGVLGTWDQQDLVMTAGYYHENLWSETSTYSYIDHASELFSADGMLAISPKFTVGAEAGGSINDFFNSASYDTWRARFGPAVRLKPTAFLRVRLGAGYERIEYNSAVASTLGLHPENTYYAYADVEHDINQFFTHSLTLSHDNQLGFNAANLEGSTVSYSLTWLARKNLRVSPLISASYYDESYGSSRAKLYHERFTYYRFGLMGRYDLGAHWQARAGWNFRLKDSDATAAGYGQNQVFVEVLYQF